MNSPIDNTQSGTDKNTTPAGFLDELVVGKGKDYKGLVVFPIRLVAEDFKRSDETFILLGSGGRTPGIHSFETGAMDRLRIVNRNSERAVILDGTTLKGGAASRMLLTSHILGKDQEVKAPVCSSEVKRWESVTLPNGKVHIKTRDISFPRSSMAIGSLKKHKFLETLPGLKRDGSLRLDQEEFWREIKKMFNTLKIRSDTYDTHTLYSHWNYLLDSYATTFRVNDPRQIGFITFLDKDSWYADIFVNNELFNMAYSELIKSYAFDAVIRQVNNQLMEAKRNVPVRNDAADVFLGLKLNHMKPMKFQGAKLEDSFFLNSKHGTGSALVNGGQLIYLSACSKIDKKL